MSRISRAPYEVRRPASTRGDARRREAGEWYASAIGGSAYGQKNIGKKFFNIIFAHNEMSSRDAIEAVMPKENKKIKIKKILNYKLEKVLAELTPQSQDQLAIFNILNYWLCLI